MAPLLLRSVNCWISVPSGNLPKELFLTRSILPESPVADIPPGSNSIARNANNATPRNTIVPFICLILLNCSWRDYYASLEIAERNGALRQVQQQMRVELPN